MNLPKNPYTPIVGYFYIDVKGMMHPFSTEILFDNKYGAPTAHLSIIFTVYNKTNPNILKNLKISLYNEIVMILSFHKPFLPGKVALKSTTQKIIAFFN